MDGCYTQNPKQWSLVGIYIMHIRQPGIWLCSYYLHASAIVRNRGAVWPVAIAVHICNWCHADSVGQIVGCKQLQQGPWI